jgi:hypothetical protein
MCSTQVRRCLSVTIMPSSSREMSSPSNAVINGVHPITGYTESNVSTLPATSETWTPFSPLHVKAVLEIATKLMLFAFAVRASASESPSRSFARTDTVRVKGANAFQPHRATNIQFGIHRAPA